MNMKMISNHVLVRPDTKNYETVKVGEVELQLDTQFEKQKHSTVSGEVVEVPDRVKYDGVSYIPDLRKGDTAIWHYHDIPQAKAQGRIVKEGEWYESNILAALQYECFFIAIRDDKVIALNGTIVVEAMEEEVVTSNLLHLPDHLRKTPSVTCGRVLYCGTPFKTEFDYSFVKPGVVVYFAEYNSVPLQYDMHQILDKGKTLYRLRHGDVLAGLVE